MDPRIDPRLPRLKSGAHPGVPVSGSPSHLERPRCCCFRAVMVMIMYTSYDLEDFLCDFMNDLPGDTHLDFEGHLCDSEDMRVLFGAFGNSISEIVGIAMVCGTRWQSSSIDAATALPLREGLRQCRQWRERYTGHNQQSAFQ